MKALKWIGILVAVVFLVGGLGSFTRWSDTAGNAGEKFLQGGFKSVGALYNGAANPIRPTLTKAKQKAGLQFDADQQGFCRVTVWRNRRGTMRRESGLVRVFYAAEVGCTPISIEDVTVPPRGGNYIPVDPEPGIYIFAPYAVDAKNSGQPVFLVDLEDCPYVYYGGAFRQGERVDLRITRTPEEIIVLFATGR